MLGPVLLPLYTRQLPSSSGDEAQTAVFVEKEDKTLGHSLIAVAESGMKEVSNVASFVLASLTAI